MATTQLGKTVSVRILEDAVQTSTESFSTTTTITQYVSTQLTIAAATTNQLISCAPLSKIQELYIETTGQITVRLNLITNPAVVCKDIWYLSTDSITALYLTNAATSPVTVKLVFA